MDIKKHFKKYGIVVAIIISFGIIVALAVQVPSFLRRRELDRMVHDMKQAEEDWHAAQMADTYGGTTPQETLRMFIDAMEKEDYELASKYFVIERQQEELDGMGTAPKENIDNVLVMLRECLDAMDTHPLEEVGSYSFNNKNGYLIEKPIAVDFFLYPNGIWKIEEI
ncbi:MAG: hypothetical protein V1652_00865 [bacterium]